jgi:hypothetical protein
MELVAAFPVDVTVTEKWEKPRKAKDGWNRTCKVEWESKWPCRIIGVEADGTVYALRYSTGWGTRTAHGWERIGVCLDHLLLRPADRPWFIDREIAWEVPWDATDKSERGGIQTPEGAGETGAADSLEHG